MINPETLFTKDELERIEQAVVAAEGKTSGEIVPMIVGASARYADAELTGVVVGMVVGTLIEFIAHDPWGPVHAYVLWPVAGAILGHFIFSVRFVKRTMLPTHRIAEAVRLRSLAAFAEHGLHYTKDHTGILIFASLLERRVVVLADRGINERVAPGTWQVVVDTLTDGLKSGKPCDGFCNAIEHCGGILAAHFPRQTDDQNELPNALVTESE